MLIPTFHEDYINSDHVAMLYVTKDPYEERWSVRARLVTGQSVKLMASYDHVNVRHYMDNIYRAIMDYGRPE